MLETSFHIFSLLVGSHIFSLLVGSGLRYDPIQHHLLILR